MTRREAATRLAYIAADHHRTTRAFVSRHDLEEWLASMTQPDRYPSFARVANAEEAKRNGWPRFVRDITKRFEAIAETRLI